MTIFSLFRFFGMVVGKAVYEGILLKAQFARFFIDRFSGTGGNQMDELQAMDPDLYSNLMKLKYYEGEAADLGLFFAVEEELLGTKRLIPLVKNGENEPVTK